MSEPQEEATREALHYMKVLKANYSPFQEQIRDAIDYAIDLLEIASEDGGEQQ